MKRTHTIKTAPEVSGDSYIELTSIEGQFLREPESSNLTEITDENDSMPMQTFHLKVADGNYATLTASLEVDDWGYIHINKVDSTSSYSLPFINLTEDIEPAGVRGGHVLWSETKSVLLPSGNYDIIVWHKNATYLTGDAHYNTSICNYSITINHTTVPLLEGNTTPYPVHIDVVFNERSEDEVPAEDKDKENTSTYCASGYRFLGTATVLYSDGSTSDFSVQTGGWMSKDCKLPKPSQEDLENNYDRKLWPDTACPPSASAMHTKLSGEEVPGYSIDVPSSTKRSALKVHLALRTGSEGCISTKDSTAWEEFKKVMELSDKAFPDNPLGFSVYYSCEQPDPNRRPN